MTIGLTKTKIKLPAKINYSKQCAIQSFLFQVGLVPKNYLVELSQYLTNDVGASNGRAANHASGNGSAGGPANSALPADHDQIQSQPWYYGKISRSECDNVLGERGIDGDFLIRDSETNVSKNRKKIC